MQPISGSRDEPISWSFFSGGLLANLKLGANVTVFLLFFGISFIDAIVSGHWVGVFLWAAFGALFLRADNRKAVTQ